MITKPLLLATALLAAPQTFAQWAVVPEAGLNFSKYEFNISSINSKLRGGYRAGVTAALPLSNLFFLQPGVLMLMNGYNISNNINEMRTVTSIYTVQIPLCLMLKTGKPGKDRFFASAGCYVASNMAGSYKTYNGPYTTTGTLTFGNDSRSTLTSNEAGITASIGCEFNNHITAQLNGQRGATAINSTGDAKLYRYQFGLSIGYAFGAHSIKVKHKAPKTESEPAKRPDDVD